MLIRVYPWLVLAVLVGAGCGYSAGFKPRGGIKSVAVPIFENRSLRREVEFPLTEAVVREVQRRTPLIVTSPDRADVTLRGTIERFDQAVLVEGRRDEVLESSAVIALGVTGVDREGRELFRHTGPTALVESSQFVEGRGESLARPTADAFRDLAERVVMLLEEGMERTARKP